MSHLDELIADFDAFFDNTEICAGSSEDSYKRKQLYEDCLACYGRAIYKLTGKDISINKGMPIKIYELKQMYRLLCVLRDSQEHELAVAQAQSGNVNISSSSKAVAMATVETTFSNTMSQMWALPDDVLTDNQKQELTKMLQEVESSKGDEGKLRKVGKAVADWLFDNAVKAIPSVMPYVTQAIQGAFGQ